MASTATLPGAAQTQRGRRPYALWGLLLAQVTVWVIVNRVLKTDDAWQEFALRLDAPTGLGLLLSPFVHVQPSHLTVNLLVLWLFGRRLELMLGSLPFLLLYLGAAWFAALMNLAVAQVFGMVLFQDRELAAVGSSGAVAGVLGLYFVRLPHTRFRLPWGQSSHIWAGPILGAWLGYEFAQAVIQTVALGIQGLGHWAHFAGFIFGIAAALGMRLHRDARLEELSTAADSATTAGDHVLAARYWSWVLSLAPEARPVRRRAILTRAAAGDLPGALRLAVEGLTTAARGADDAAAADAYEQYLEMVGSVELPAGIRFRLASHLTAVGRHEAARTAYLLAAEEAAGGTDAPAALFRAGQIAADQLSDPEGCRRDWERILADYPESPWRQEVELRLPHRRRQRS